MFEKKNHITYILASLQRSRRDNCQIATDNILFHTELFTTAEQSALKSLISGGASVVSQSNISLVLHKLFQCHSKWLLTPQSTISNTPPSGKWMLSYLREQWQGDKNVLSSGLLITPFCSVCLHFLSLWHSSELWETTQNDSLRLFPPQKWLLFYAILPLLRSTFP